MEGIGCHLEDNCVSTTNFPYEYEHNEECRIEILGEVSVFTETFEIETCCDEFAIMDQVNVKTVDEIPRRMSSGDYITWMTDSSVAENGWKLCFNETEPEDAPFIMEGNCEVVGECLSSSGYGRGLYSNNEECSITMLVDAEVSVGSAFSIELCCDHLTIGGVEINTPEDVPRILHAGDKIVWSTDVSIVMGGWQLCLTEISEEVDEGELSWNFFQQCRTKRISKSVKLCTVN